MEQVRISKHRYLGKKYSLGKIDEFQQALDKLARLYQEAPLKGAGEEGGEGAEADFGGGGGGGDFPWRRRWR